MVSPITNHGLINTSFVQQPHLRGSALTCMRRYQVKFNRTPTMCSREESVRTRATRVQVKYTYNCASPTKMVHSCQDAGHMFTLCSCAHCVMCICSGAKSSLVANTHFAFALYNIKVPKVYKRDNPKEIVPHIWEVYFRPSILLLCCDQTYEQHLKGHYIGVP